MTTTNRSISRHFAPAAQRRQPVSSPRYTASLYEQNWPIRREKSGRPDLSRGPHRPESWAKSRAAKGNTCKALTSGVDSPPLGSTDLAVDPRGLGREIEFLADDEQRAPPPTSSPLPAATSCSPLSYSNRRPLTQGKHVPPLAPGDLRVPAPGAWRSPALLLRRYFSIPSTPEGTVGPSLVPAPWRRRSAGVSGRTPGRAGLRFLAERLTCSVSGTRGPRPGDQLRMTARSRFAHFRLAGTLSPGRSTVRR